MWTDPLLQGLFWSAATIGFYAAARQLFRRLPRWWASPLLVTPLLLLALALCLHEGYSGYIQCTHWLILMLGPATVAFAVPIYEQRAVIRRQWPVLLVGVFAGSVIAMGTAWILADVLGLSASMRMSLLPRSVSTPFAMTVSGDLGGSPELTAMFVVLTGLIGASLGQGLLQFLPLRTTVARGALFGMGAHGVGVATANRIGREEGSIAGLVMILAGLGNVLAAPALAYLLRRYA